MSVASLSPSEAFLDLNETHFRQAVHLGLPIFLTNARQSTPLDATPYLVRYQLFRQAASMWAGRGDLVAKLETVLINAKDSGVNIEAMMIGGSFTELEKSTIDDVDCLLFYRIDPHSRGTAALQRLQKDAQENCVDARFVPLDSDHLTLLKLVSYFTILYSKHKDTNEIMRCLLLVDCRDAGLP